jgi:hypothetical protein
MRSTSFQGRDTEGDEAQQVRDWRLAQLFRAGFDPEDAVLLAEHVEVDMHEALRLVERGCPSKTALRILL